ncbi:MAG: endonuclease [Succinivibrio sp.]|nr:endonuclease [Succinivibrio sp.]
MLDKPMTLYCSCPIIFTQSSSNKKGYMVRPDDCGYKIRQDKKRANRIEAEHIMPAYDFGHQMKCWQSKGRRQNCSENDAQFQRMEGDLHNLYPSIGEVNADRKNYHYGDWNAKPGMYGKCPMVVDNQLKLAQPPHSSRGIVARATLYMAERYHIKISAEQQKLFLSWNKMYPPTPNECLRNKLIASVQGNENHFVSRECEFKGINTQLTKTQYDTLKAFLKSLHR